MATESDQKRKNGILGNDPAAPAPGSNVSLLCSQSVAFSASTLLSEW